MPAATTIPTGGRFSATWWTICSCRRWRGRRSGLLGDCGGFFAAEVRGEGELDQVGEEVLELFGLTGDDAPGDQRDHAADERFLGRRREAREDLGRAALAALFEVGDEALDRRV